MLKFLLDENISRSTFHFLQSMGFDARSVHDYNLAGADDIDILRKAALTSRIIITHDLDFGNLLVTPVHFTGVIILRLKDQTPQNTNKILGKLLKGVEKRKIIDSL
ncbi:MAG: DUF5615 family PIN-like protein, partial [Candidatus Margulisiibacteriota bacterium]